MDAVGQGLLHQRGRVQGIWIKIILGQRIRHANSLLKTEDAHLIAKGGGSKNQWRERLRKGCLGSRHFCQRWEMTATTRQKLEEKHRMSDCRRWLRHGYLYLSSIREPSWRSRLQNVDIGRVWTGGTLFSSKIGGAGDGRTCAQPTDANELVQAIRENQGASLPCEGLPGHTPDAFRERTQENNVVERQLEITKHGLVRSPGCSVWSGARFFA